MQSHSHPGLSYNAVFCFVFFRYLFYVTCVSPVFAAESSTVLDACRVHVKRFDAR